MKKDRNSMGTASGARPEIVASGKHLSLVKSDNWEFVTRKNCNGVVIIVPLLENGKLLFVEQFRAPVDRRVIEFPAGLVGDDVAEKGESLEDAAARELAEETGYRSAEFEHLYTGPSSAGLTDEVTSIFLANNLVKVGTGGGVGREKITMHQVPLPDINPWLAAAESRGCLVDARVHAGLFLLYRVLLGKK